MSSVNQDDRPETSIENPGIDAGEFGGPSIYRGYISADETELSIAAQASAIRRQIALSSDDELMNDAKVRLEIVAGMSSTLVRSEPVLSELLATAKSRNLPEHERMLRGLQEELVELRSMLAVLQADAASRSPGWIAGVGLLAFRLVRFAVLLDVTAIVLEPLLELALHEDDLAEPLSKFAGIIVAASVDLLDNNATRSSRGRKIDRSAPQEPTAPGTAVEVDDATTVEPIATPVSHDDSVPSRSSSFSNADLQRSLRLPPVSGPPGVRPPVPGSPGTF